jgi:hypothetical protein
VIPGTLLFCGVDLDGFWTIVESTNGDIDAIVEELERLPLADIADFAQIQDRLEWDAYRNDLWLACVLINGGYGSDDGFLYFRDWLILQGRRAFETALSDPDSLGTLPAAIAIAADADEVADREDFLYVANHAWENLTGDENGLDDELDARGFEAMRDQPLEPAGEHIPFDDRDRIFAVMPRLSAMFYERAARTRRSLAG